MTDRAAIVAGITEIVEELSGAPPGSFPPDYRLMDHGEIDSLTVVEIAQQVEDRFFADDTTVILDAEPDWTVDKIADAVIAQLAAKEGAVTDQA